jgi:hypothetical protein
MEIVKFENIGGIRSLDYPELIRGNVAIYSPNGTMKTSFSTGLLNIQNGVDPSDVDQPGTAKFEIKNGADIISSLADGPKLHVLVIRREVEGKGFSADKVLTAAQGIPASLAMSDALKTRYEEASVKLKKLAQRAEDILRLSFKTHSKLDPEKLAADWMGSEKTCLDLVCSLTEADFASSQKMPKSARSVDFVSASKPAVVHLGKDIEFQKNVETYVACVKKDFSEKGIFNSDFTVDSLQAFYDSAVETSYFSANHKLLINGKTYGQAETNDLLQRAIKEIYGDPDNKKAFFNSKDKLDKKNVAPIKNIIDTKPELLSGMQDYDSFLRQLICLSFTDFSAVESIKKDFSELEAEIAKIAKESEKEKPIWNDTVEAFNHRFFSNGFTANLTNREMVLLKKAPAIQLVKKKDGKPVSPALQNKFSTGEKDSLWILNILFDIQKELGTGKPLTIVLDDVADSFDYKNKYALIMYLNDLVQDPLNQIIVLTHSFDFFRTAMALGKDRISGLLAYKQEIQSIGSNVALLPCDDHVYTSLVAVNGWKQFTDLKYGFAYLPVLRNLEQISEGTSSCQSVKDLDSLMHYNCDTPSKTIEDMKNIFAETHFGRLYNPITKTDDVPCRFFPASGVSTFYFDALYAEAKRIGSAMPETDLPSKIVLALYIRMACEKMMVGLLTCASIALPSDSTFYSRDLQKLVIGNKLVSEEQQEIIEESLLVGNSFAHMNSFLDAPLIDVGPEQLKRLYDYFEH